MALAWENTPRKRVMLAGLNLLARLARPWLGLPAAEDTHSGTIRRILVVELWNIGDVVLTLPFLAQLRAIFPEATVTLLARRHASELLEGSGLVDEFIRTDLGWSDARIRYNPLRYDWAELLRLRRALRARRFDVAFQSRLHVREHFILAMSGARRRVGYAFGGGDRLLSDAVPVGDAGRHKAADWLELLAPFGGPVAVRNPRLHVAPAERAWRDEYLLTRGVSPTDVVIGVHPGASSSEKRWPLERFHAVAAALSTRSGVRVVAFIEPGGYGAILGGIPGVISAQVGLRSLTALLHACDVLVCNDSGPMHIAGALGVPTVAVFAAGIDRWFSPLGEGHELLSSPGYGGDSELGQRPVGSTQLAAVPASAVLAAVDRVLDRQRALLRRS